MLFSGLRSAEVLGLRVRDVDIGRGWVRVIGKGDKERRVPLDPDVAGLIQTYLFAERPESDRDTLFLVAKGPNRGKPLTPAGLRTVFRYHRAKAGVPAGHPHALRHSFGTALAEAGVDLAVLQALMGHDHVDSSAAYIHLVPGARARRLRCRPRPPARPVVAPRRGRCHAGRSCSTGYRAALAARGAGNRRVPGCGPRVPGPLARPAGLGRAAAAGAAVGRFVGPAAAELSDAGRIPAARL